MNMETPKRKIEVFSAGCACCEEAIAIVQRAACPSCDVTILDMRNEEVAKRAKRLGVRSVPAVAIDDKLASCCTGGGPNEAALRSAGIGKAGLAS